MGQPSSAASNVVIYLTYTIILLMGTYIAWKLRNQAKTDFLSSNGTQTAFPLALNFIASALGSSTLFTYPELATIAGVQGVIFYALASALPMLVFGYLGPIIRRHCPDGFVLTEWTRQRYGTAGMFFLSFLTLVTLFLYMIAELSAIGQVINGLTGQNGLPVMIVQCVVTTIYTSLGGFKISFLTDIVQGGTVVGLIIIATIAVGAKTDIKRELIDSSGLTQASLLGWQLLYILPVAILTNDFFLSNLWLRTFSSKTDMDLRAGVTMAMVVILCILTLVGCTGLLSVWSGSWPGNPPESGSLAFFMLLRQFPSWVVGLVLVMVVSLSTATFDSLQSAMVSSASNDLFRNNLSIWLIRGLVVVVIIPVVVLALRAPSVLQIFFISDLVSSAAIPVLCVGLIPQCWFWRGFEFVGGTLGGILSVFIFGARYYGDVYRGARLILLEDGLYAKDWSVFGAFVAAPLGGLLWGCIALVFRLTIQYVKAKLTGSVFDALEKPGPETTQTSSSGDEVAEEITAPGPGKFF